jgi:hypothetical protein
LTEFSSKTLLRLVKNASKVDSILPLEGTSFPSTFSLASILRISNFLSGVNSKYRLYDTKIIISFSLCFISLPEWSITRSQTSFTYSTCRPQCSVLPSSTINLLSSCS